MSIIAIRRAGIGFEHDCPVVPIDRLIPVKKLRVSTKASKKYRQIAASVREVGLVEPPVVARDKRHPGRFLLLDGHLRVEILKGMGKTEVQVLVSTDDESFTFNKRISRMTAVQEHKMVVRAIERGVPEGRIAAALSVDVTSIQRRVRLLDGICREAEDILKDRPCPGAVFQLLKKLKPMRQIDAAEMMRDNNNYSVAYAQAIVVATPQSELVDPAKPKGVKGVTAEQIARMERELGGLQRDSKAIETSYATNNLHLTVVRRFIERMVANSRIAKHLEQRHPEFLSEFRRIADMESLVAA